MKKQTIKKRASTHATVDLTHCGAPAQFAMRTECSVDCVLIRAALGRWVTMWREDRSEFIALDGTTHSLPDMDVVFSLKASAPSLKEVRWLLECLIDCHVAAETLMPVHEYTGERVYRDGLVGLLERPSDAFIKEARDCARKTKSCLRAEFGRMSDAANRWNAELGNVEGHLAG